MANDEHVAKLREGAAVWNKWWNAHPKTIPDFRKADLKGADLSDVILHGVDLFKANLIHADLRNANLARADLYDASLGNL